MKITNTTNDIKSFGIFLNKLLTFGPNGDIVVDGFNLYPKFNNDQCAFSRKDSLNTIYLNNSLEQIDLENFGGNWVYKNGFLVGKLNARIYFYLDNKQMSEIGPIIPRTYPVIDNYFIRLENYGTKILIYDYPDLIWEKDISNYGEKRVPVTGEELNENTTNGIEPNYFAVNQSLIVPLPSGQILSLNLKDGTDNWFMEKGGNSRLCHNNEHFYTLGKNIFTEFDISTAKKKRQLDLNEFLIENKEYIFQCAISNGKLILDFVRNYSNLLIIDLDRFEIESYIKNPYRSIMLRVRNGKSIWFENKVYALDPLSNILYTFE